MNVSKSPLRRATALVAGSLIGIAGAVAFASPAMAHHSVPTGTFECDKVAGEWVIDWKVDTFGTKDGNKFQFTTVELTPTNKIDSTDIVVAPAGSDKWLPSNTPVFGKQRVPGDTKRATLKVAAKWNNDAIDKDPVEGEVKPTGECKKTPPANPGSSSPAPRPSSSAPSAPSAPSSPAPSASTSVPPVSIPEEVPAEPILEVTCDTMTIGVDNTSNDTKFTLDFKTSKGEERTLVVAPGKKDTATFSATEGFSVDVTFTVAYKGKTYSETGTIPFEKPAEGCDEGQGGGLPVTGAAAGGVAAGAAGLLAVGGALFFLARRRKVKFTA